ncbi:DUF1697 domain-containing protein [Galbibacter sp. EGI 63066]|uniref:DUF1697 domain-containing protein n=1 Tax=Galbibacter sp. EGI 63066 TaxID=2993559 RepID=UPI002249768B|nr:DUF1697 domain-containing protein [Galbibacter sp. EGI 63066]MCX2681381.1 DUF1697 domain-containing protein [Galbibacter sp. EGI 63066]
MKPKEKYIAFLRGINVGGHHKVPMAELRKEMEVLGFENVITLLNSGNAIFEAVPTAIEDLEKTISEHIEKVFGFPIPTLIRKAETIYKILTDDPFKNIEVTKDIRLYVSFLQKNVDSTMELPWISPEGTYKIIGRDDKTIFSVLDVSVTKTPKAMEVLGKYFKTDITTRNWNTIKRIEKKLEAGN